MKREIVRSNQVLMPLFGSLGTKAGPFLFLSSQVAYNPETGRLVKRFSDLKDYQGRSLESGFMAYDSWRSPLVPQTWFLFHDIIRELLEEHGASLDHILRINIWNKDFVKLPVLGPVRSKVFEPQTPPPITNIQVEELGADKDTEICMEAIALASGEMKKEVVHSNRVYQQVGHYELGTKAGPFIFLAGLIAADANKGMVVKEYADLGEQGHYLATGRRATDSYEGPVIAQTWFILERIKWVLEEQGSSLDDVLRANVYMRDLRDLPTVERVYMEFFLKDPPALTVLQVDGLGMADFLLEIEAVAIVPGREGAGVVRREVISADAPSNLTCYSSPATMAGSLIFLAGQMAADIDTGEVIERLVDLERSGLRLPNDLRRTDIFEEPMTAQACFIFQQIEKLLRAGGSSLENALKLHIYVRDFRDVPALKRVFEMVFPKDPPAIRLVQVSGLPVPDALLQVDAIALVPD